MGEVKYIVQSGFAENAAQHGFFTRAGGVSLEPYTGLNCGYGSDDDPSAVQANRELVAAEFGVSESELLTLYQEHGANCLTVAGAHDPKNAPKGDAFVTSEPGLILGVLTADCAPVLFYADGAQPIIGAAHAGWRGAVGGVLGSTVAAMEALGAKRSDIQACIGPCIGKSSYEVSEEFLMPFIEESDENERFFSAAQKDGHYMFDLAGYCALKLSLEGVTQIFIQEHDTYVREADFFSYRRTTHRNEKDYGRQVSAIMIKPRN